MGRLKTVFKRVVRMEEWPGGAAMSLKEKGCSCDFVRMLDGAVIRARFAGCVLHGPDSLHPSPSWECVRAPYLRGVL